MLVLILVVGITVFISAFCSVLEALILSTTVADIEALKRDHLKHGEMLERFKINIEETSSAILSLNTIVNTLGAIIAGGLATEHWGQNALGYFSIVFTFVVLFFSEILPKNIGILYRKRLQVHLVYPLMGVVKLMLPITALCGRGIRLILKKKNVDHSKLEEEIVLLAEKSVQDGELTIDERNMIVNAIELDHVLVESIMTPRSVITALDETLTVEAVCDMHKALPFGRLPIYKDSIDHITGFVRRRDILNLKIEEKDSVILSTLKNTILFIEKGSTVAETLRSFLKHHEQIAIVVDEFGLVMGLITMEDVIEQVLGQEIFEKGDLAMDMRDLARTRYKGQQNSI
jgi:CBS domain containing-hemolysin-like protein